MAWPEDRCPSCPLTEGLCKAQALKTARLCDLANPEHPAFRKEYRDMLVGVVESPTRAQETPAGAEPATDGRPTPRDHLQALAKMKRCRHWVKQGCGCSANTCLRGLGSFDRGKSANIADCVACMEGGKGWEAREDDPDHERTGEPVEIPPPPAEAPVGGQTARQPTDSPEPGEAPPALPSLARQAVNFGKALMTHVLAGRPTLDDNATEARLAICRACPMYRPDGRCSACGCVVSIKARWAGEECPEGRWEGVPIASGERAIAGS